MLLSPDTWLVWPAYVSPIPALAPEQTLTQDALRKRSEETRVMNIAKALAVSAVAGMLVGSTVACGGGAAATPDANSPAAGGKSSCSGSAAPSGGSTAAPAGSGKSSCSAAGGATPAPKY
jgi:hypothetical protein